MHHELLVLGAASPVSNCPTLLLGAGSREHEWAETHRDLARANNGAILTLRLGLVRDYRAECWPSMDLCADQLLAHLPAEIASEDVAPPFRRIISRLPFPSRAGFNADRLLNRHLLLPPVVRRAAARADFVHIVDHSFAHLVHAVPRGRAGVYCHDLDAFRCLLEPAKDRRPWWFRQFARRILTGLQRAVVVFHSTAADGARIRSLIRVPAERLVLAPYGVAREFTEESTCRVELPVPIDPPFLLHVGSNIPRKRLDVLLDLFAVVRERVPALRLVQVGGPWPPPLAEQIRGLGIESFVSQMQGISRSQLAGLYRGAAAVLVTSEAEGFGLPVIEALACGAVAIASDIPTLREAGGDAAVYCPVGNVPAWADAVTRSLHDRDFAPSRDIRLSHAARFSWREHARIIAQTYLALASGGHKSPGSRT